jgi:hypothetical protein
MRVTFASGTAEKAWELRTNQHFVCRTPCTRWLTPSDRYEMRTETGPDFQTVDVPDLRRFSKERELEVRAHPRNQGKLLGGIITAGLGGGFAFIGGMLALAGGASGRDGLTLAGGITAGIGLAAVGPGVYFLATSGSKAEVYTERGLEEAYGPPPPPPQVGVTGTF